MSLLMGRLESELRHVEVGLAAAVRKYHLRQQLLRLAAGVAGAVVLSVTRGGPGPLDWKAALPLAVAAALAYLRSQVPTVPWEMLRVRLGLPPVDVEDASTVRTAPANPAGVPGVALDVPRNADGTWGPASVSNPPSEPGA